jgi:hypothetical protein
VCRVNRSFIDAAGPRLARSTTGLWRQVGLLAVAVAVDGSDGARLGLARGLLALDHPDEAASVAAAASDTPWGLWLGVIAVGQQGLVDRARRIAEVTRRGLSETPDGREVARRLVDLEAELDALSGADNGARFDLLGHEARPERRVLLVGRSSASYLVDPGDGGGPIRLAPYEGASAGNRAHQALSEIVESIGSGSVGLGRSVPPDRPEPLRPEPMLAALAETGRLRTEELAKLAEDVKHEREELAKRAEELEDELARLIAERARLKQVPTPNGATANGHPPHVPRTQSEAAAVLGVGPTSSRTEIERAYRDLVRSAHPDRVADLHPGIRQEAESLTVALNAARDILLPGR